MIRLHFIRNYKKIYPELKASRLSEALLRDILEQEGFRDPHILRTTEGKPYEEQERVCFSLSHCGDLFACALCEGPIGLDVEHRGRKTSARKIAERFFTREESDLIDQDEDLFLKLWTRKEALVKYRGCMLDDVLGESVLDREDVDFIEKETEEGLIVCICLSREEDNEISISCREQDL